MPDTPTASGETATLALSHPDLVPPPRPVQFTAGATAELRDAMARFSGPADHAPRRAAIVDCVAAIDLAEVTNVAAAITDEHLGDESVDVVALSWAVPTYTLAQVLGVAGDREAVRADTEAIARVIGRNEPSSAVSDAAAERLLAACAGHDDPVAVASILYQNHDATSGLIRSEAVAAFTARGAPAPASTRRVATAPTTIGELDIAAGSEVVIDLAGMRYGAGPHRCPGEAMAVAIASAVTGALQRCGYQCDPAAVEVDAAGAATRLVMEVAQ